MNDPYQLPDEPNLSPDWRGSAACAQTDPELWFPERGGSPRNAKRVCRTCPVRWECLAYALTNDERHGVWGGYMPDERAQMRKPRTAAPTVAIRDRVPIDIGDRAHGTHAGWNAGCKCRACETAEKFYQRSRHLQRGSGGAA